MSPGTGVDGDNDIRPTASAIGLVESGSGHYRVHRQAALPVRVPIADKT